PPAPPVGTGPYRFVRSREDGSLEFAPHAAYHLGSPSIPRIILTRIADDAERARAVAHGQVDLAPIRPEETGPFRRRSNTWVVRMLTGAWRGMPLNMQHPALQDIRVRQAIDLSLDRQEIVAAALPSAGRPAYQPMSPLSFAFSAKLDEPYADPGRARELLDQAGWFTSDRGLRYRGRNPKTQVAFGTAALPPRDAVALASASGTAGAAAAEEGGPDSDGPLTLKLLVPRDDTFRLRAAEVIRAQLRRVGILVEIDAVDAAAYASGTASMDDRYDAWIGEWDSLLDPGGSLYREFHTDGRENRTGYSNATMDRMLDLCRGATDKTAAKDLYERLMENLRPEAVVLPLAYPETLFAARTRVAGLRESVIDDVSGFSRNAWRWHLEDE
ncbi:MAG TPA: ABC transporter substrate-binding protein, partial [Candidatus Saccharimonadales bacterium]|nr:ABC transporter substrate-binding protein [Candidatus Saccharimonadales bacterium]